MRRIAVLMMLAVAWGIGCDKSDESSKKWLDKEITFEVDGEGVFYVTFGANGEKHPANSLEEIPRAERGRVGVHVDGEMPEEMVGKQVYVANLVGAKPGDRFRAELEGFNAFAERSRVASRGGWQGRAVYRTAGRMLGMDVPAEESHPPLREVEGGGEDGQPRVDNPTPSDDGEVVIRSVDELKTAGASSKGGRFIDLSKPGEARKLLPQVDKPAGSQTQEPSRGTGGGSDDEAEPTYWPVVLYGANWCSYCKKAKRWMQSHNVPFEWRNIESSSQAKREMVEFCREKGVKPGSIPTIRIKTDDQGGDRVMQGWDPGTFRKLAAR